MERRDFLKLGTSAIAASALTAPDVLSAQTAPAGTTGFAVPPIPTVRIGYVGVGGQGSSHVRNLLKIKGCQVTAVCDISRAISSACARPSSSISCTPRRRGNGTCR